jgi:hypothetical protein
LNFLETSREIDASLRNYALTSATVRMTKEMLPQGRDQSAKRSGPISRFSTSSHTECDVGPLDHDAATLSVIQRIKINQIYCVEVLEKGHLIRDYANNMDI